MSKASHHEDFGNVLTIGWFCYAFFFMSAQNSAIFGWSDINFLQLGIIGS